MDIFEYGKPAKQGARTDLEKAASVAKETLDIRAVADASPVQFIKYHRGIERYIQVLKSTKQRHEKTQVHFFYGATGTGKSRTANREAKAIGSVYYKPRGEWWDGYEQQDCVILDDFYGWLPYDELLRLCDRYPHRVPVKGGYEIFNSKHIFITSNKPLEELYRFDRFTVEPLKRRIEDIRLFE